MLWTRHGLGENVGVRKFAGDSTAISSKPELLLRLLAVGHPKRTRRIHGRLLIHCMKETIFIFGSRRWHSDRVTMYADVSISFYNFSVTKIIWISLHYNSWQWSLEKGWTLFSMLWPISVWPRKRRYINEKPVRINRTGLIFCHALEPFHFGSTTIPWPDAGSPQAPSPMIFLQHNSRSETDGRAIYLSACFDYQLDDKHNEAPTAVLMDAT